MYEEKHPRPGTVIFLSLVKRLQPNISTLSVESFPVKVLPKQHINSKLLTGKFFNDKEYIKLLAEYKRYGWVV